MVTDLANHSYADLAENSLTSHGTAYISDRTRGTTTQIGYGAEYNLSPPPPNTYNDNPPAIRSYDCTEKSTGEPVSGS